jgi:outer membrane autotransporter protein
MQDNDRTRSVWVNPFGVFYGERSGGDHLGFQSNVAGVQLGLDKQVSEACILGIGAGYDNMHISTSDLYSAGRTDTFRVGPYATWFNDEWYFDSSLTGGFHDNNMGRSVSVGADNYMARGDYFAKDLSLYAGGGPNYRMGNSIVSPLVSLQYITYRQDGFTESDADGAALQMDPLNVNSLRSRVGGQVAQTCQWRSVKVVPEVFAGWAHEYLQNDVLEARFVGGVTPFLTDRGGIFRDAGYYGLSLTALPRDHTSLFARYNGEYSTGGHFTAVDLGMIVEF